VGQFKTYEARPGGSDASGLEDYLVETRDGKAAGKVLTLLDHEGKRFLALDGGPAGKRRAVWWDDVREVDHDALTVFLDLDEAALARAHELERGNEVEGGVAEARRLTALPRELARPARPESGPTDEPTYAGAIIFFALGLFALLALALAAGSTSFTWEFALFAVPVVLILAAGELAYRAWRSPYAR
jgi:hypothetical protein